MKILNISSDRKIFQADSGVRKRITDYSSLVDSLECIVFSLKSDNLKSQKISTRFSLHPTNSINRFLYISDCYTIGSKVESVDVISTQDPFESGIAGFLLSRKHKAKLHVQIHTDFLNPYFKKESVLNFLRLKIANFIIPRADRLRVVSERIKRSLVARFGIDPNKVDVLPIFTDINVYRRVSPTSSLKDKYKQSNFIALMVSRLEKEKNIELAIKAFSRIVKKNRFARLVIAGDGSNLNNLKKLVREKKLLNNISFIGWQSDLVSYFKTADVFINTSNYEGYGLALLEALASGCLILTTDVGLVGEIVTKDNALICPVGDLDCFVSSLESAIKNKNIAHTKIFYSHEVLDKLSNTTYQAYLERYKESWVKCWKTKD
jgi:glycosyltransferase involved in cell wall biosynthesis